MNIITWFKVCRKEGHRMVFDHPTLGGEYIKCVECNQLDEYLPGLHEPKGYKSKDKYVDNVLKAIAADKKYMKKIVEEIRPEANPPKKIWK